MHEAKACVIKKKYIAANLAIFSIILKDRHLTVVTEHYRLDPVEKRTAQSPESCLSG